MDRLGRDVLELMDALEVAQANFCGLSMGGMVGQWLGVRAPDRVCRLILANTSAFMGPPLEWDRRIDAVRIAGMSSISDAVLERWFTPRFRKTSPDAVARVQTTLLATSAQGYVGCCAAIRDMDQRRLLSLIAAPTLVIAGSEDPATPPDHSKTLFNQIPGAQLKVLSAAHMSNVEAPEAFTDAILDWSGA